MKELAEFEKDLSFETNSFDIYNPDNSDNSDLEDFNATASDNSKHKTKSNAGRCSPLPNRKRRLSIEKHEQLLYAEISNDLESSYIRRIYILDFGLPHSAALPPSITSATAAPTS